jgi:phage major head subunit gpT-like protein
MTVITKEVLQGLDNNINVTWKKRFESAPKRDDWKQIADQVNSTNSSEKYAWLGAVPGLREFKSERIPGTLSSFGYEITNKKFESTLDVDRDTIEDDHTGQILRAVNALSTKAAQAYTKLVTAAFQLAFTTPVFDGNNFFDTTHVVNGQSTGSNYLGTAKDITGANTDAMELLLAGQSDDKGDPLGYQGTHLLVGPYNYAAANALVGVPTLASGASNPYYQRYQIVKLPYLGVSEKRWALADLEEGELPFILQIRTAITLVAKTDLNSDRAFDKDIFTWGTRARHNAGFGNHQLAVGAVAN